MTFAEALRVAEKWIDRIPGIERVAEGLVEGEPCITVFVSSRVAASQLPVNVGRWRVVIDGVGGRRPG
jgi:hypothetical protein